MRRASDRAQAAPPRSREEAAEAMSVLRPVAQYAPPKTHDDRPKMVRLHQDTGAAMAAADQVLTAARRIAGRVVGNYGEQLRAEVELFGPADSAIEEGDPSDSAIDQADRAVRVATGLMVRACNHLQRVERELGE